MACPHYYFKNNDYYCLKSEKYVNSDTYYKYCRNYDYDDCPIYKGDNSGGCFITSACVIAMGKDDDCYELTILRNFRDNYLKRTKIGIEDVKKYYEIAPQIVKKINSIIDREKIYKNIYDSMISPCIKYIERREYEKAHHHYRMEVIKLNELYGCKGL